MIIKQLLLSNNFFVLNKKTVHKLGIEEAFFLSTLAECESLLADEEGWFFQTIEKIEELTTLSRKKQEKIINTLVNLKFLEKENRGVPCKRYFKLNYEIISKFISDEEGNKLVCSKRTNWNVQKEQTSTSKRDKLICPKETNYYKENNINKIDKEINYKNNIVEQIQNENIGDELKKKLVELVEYRKLIKKPYKTYISIKKLINSIGKDYIDEQHLIESIESSIINQYLGVFPKKKSKNLKQRIEEDIVAKLLRELKEEGKIYDL